MEDPGRWTCKHIFMEFDDLVARMKIPNLRQCPLRLLLIPFLDFTITKPTTWFTMTLQLRKLLITYDFSQNFRTNHSKRASTDYKGKFR